MLNDVLQHVTRAQPKPAHKRQEKTKNSIL